MSRLWIFILMLAGCGGQAFSALDPAAGDAAVSNPLDIEPDHNTSSPEAGRESDDGHDAARDAARDVYLTPEKEAGFVDSVTGSMPDGGADSAVECAAGSVRCSGMQPEVCAGGSWRASGGACSTACLNGTCTECKPGSRSCVNSTTPKICGADGSWALDVACPGVTQCFDGACLACTSGWATHCPTCPYSPNFYACCKPDNTCGCSPDTTGVCP